MALTNKGWVAAAIASCAIIWFALFFGHAAAVRTASEEQPDVLGAWQQSRQTPLGAAEGRLAQANDRLRMLEIRESVVRMAGNRDSLSIILDPRILPDTRNRIEGALRREWTTLGIVPRRPVIIALVGDTVWHSRGLPRNPPPLFAAPIEISLPSANTGGACVSLMRLSRIPNANNEITRQVRANLSSSETIAALLSPCAFFAAFGEPGPAVRSWLVDGQITASRFAGWNEAPSPWRAAIDEQTYHTSFADALSLTADPAWQIRKYVGPSGIACLANEKNACRDIVLAVRRPSPDSSWRANVINSSGTSLASFYLPRAPTPLGPGSGWILSEMVRTLGRERFEKFWTSNLPVAEAFKQASGDDIHDWTRTWALRMYGPAQVGPHLSGLGLATGLFILVIAVAGAGWIETRRRVA